MKSQGMTFWRRRTLICSRNKSIFSNYSRVCLISLEKTDIIEKLQSKYKSLLEQDTDKNSNSLVDFIRVSKLDNIFKRIKQRSMGTGLRIITESKGLSKMRQNEAEKEKTEKLVTQLTNKLTRLKEASVNELTGIKVERLTNVFKRIRVRQLKESLNLLKQDKRQLGSNLLNKLKNISTNKKTSVFLSIFLHINKKSENKVRELIKTTSYIEKNSEEDIDKLRNENQKLKNRFKDKLEIENNNNIKINKLNEEIVKLRDSNKAKETEHNELKNRFKLYTTNLEQIKKSFKTTFSSKESLVKELEKTKKKNKELVELNSDKEEAIEKLTNEFEELEIELDLLRNQTKEKKEETSKTKLKLNKIKRETEDLTEKNYKLERKNKELVKKVELVNSSKAELEAENSQLRKEVSHIEERLRYIEENQIEDLNKKNEELFKETERLGNELAVKEAAITKKEQLWSDSQNKIKKLENTIHQLTKEKLDWIKDMSHLNDDFTNIQSEKSSLANSIKKKDNTIQKLKSDNIKLKKKIEEKNHLVFNSNIINKDLQENVTLSKKNKLSHRKSKSFKKNPDNSLMQFELIEEQLNSKTKRSIKPHEDTPIALQSNRLDFDKSSYRERYSIDLGDDFSVLKEKEATEHQLSLIDKDNIDQRVNDIRKKYKIDLKNSK